MRQGRRRNLIATSRVGWLWDRFQSWSIRTKIVLLASVVVAGICVPAAIASTLTGEQFAAIDGLGQTVTVNCGPTPTSPFTYHVEGTAAGPHSGTFVEDGEVVVGPLEPSGVGPLISLDATFTIMSSMGDVSGEKHALPGGFASCQGADTAILDSTQLCYRARFSDATTEEGRSSVRLVVNRIDLGVATFDEQFFPDPTVSCRGNGEEKVTLCHRPSGNPDNAHTIEVGVSAVPHHLGHGDTPGPCLP